MKKSIKILVTMVAICAVLFTSNSVSAATIPSDTLSRVLVTEGYTSEGIHYFVYSNDTASDSIGPQAVISKQYSCYVEFPGIVNPPPSTWYLSFSDGSFNWSGTLSLEYFYAENFFGWTTYAHYIGTIFATI